MHFILDTLKEAITITLFVIVMMMIIEYINVKSKGVWSAFLRNSTWLQIILSAFLGMIPGCLGGFIVVSLYTHRLIRFGALLAALIATFGDEAYIFFGMDPGSAIELGLLLFVISIIIGFITDLIVKDKYQLGVPETDLTLHENEIYCSHHDKKLMNFNIKKINFPRALLIFGLLIYLFAILTGFLGENHHHHGHHHESDHSVFGTWLNYTYLFVTAIALIVALLVSDHFLEEHIWGHVIKKHFLKIFLWTFGALVAIHLLLETFHLEDWISDNHLTILLIALFIGIIPVSGPNLMFITLFINGTIPFSILLANSIVQDGHASLPLFAESKKSFLLVKAVKFIIGFAIGIAGYMAQW